jgi:outer membrane protein assembly factor BamA
MKKIVCRAVLAMLLSPCAVYAQTAGEVIDPSELGSLNTDPVLQLTGRIAYNSDVGAIAGLGFSTNRLLGQDQTLAFNIEGQESGARVNLRYSNDAIFGELPAFGLNITRSETYAGQVFDFDATVTRIEPHLTWELSQSLSASAYLYYAWNEIENVAAGSSALITADVGKDTTSALGFDLDYNVPLEAGSVIRDARLRFGAEIGTSTSDHDFVGMTTSAQIVHVFNDGNVVLRSQVRLGGLSSQSGNSNIGNRYMLGNGSIRGFEFGGFGPRDRAVASTPALGGNYYGVAKFDLQFPNAFGGQAARVTPGMFVDLGSLWGLDDVADGAAGADQVDDASYLRASVGVSLRINSGIGAVQIYVAHPVVAQDYDQTQTFGIELSQSF